MTYAETVRKAFPTAKAVREPKAAGGGYTVITSDNRLSWAPSAQGAWELAAGSIAVKRAMREAA